MNGHRIVLHFKNDSTEQPVIYTLCQKYNLVCSIIKAAIEPNQEGYVALEISGNENDYNEAIAYLNNINVKVDDFKRRVIRYEEKCTHCGSCSGFCPTGALAINNISREIEFDDTKCVACGLCTKACPYKSMQNNF